MKRGADTVVLDEAAAPQPMTLEEAQEAERESQRSVSGAGDELAAAREELAAARAAFQGAAACGLEAAREAQRRVNAAEARLRDATELYAALQAAHSPIAEKRLELFRVRRGVELGRTLGEKARELAAVDEEIVNALEALGAVVKRREAVVEAAGRLREEATRFSLGRFAFEDRGYDSAEIRSAVDAIPLGFRRTLYA